MGLNLIFFCIFRQYVRGAKVRLRLIDFELSSRFLGSAKDLTLLEASGYVAGIIWSPVPARNDLEPIEEPKSMNTINVEDYQ